MDLWISRRTPQKSLIPIRDRMFGWIFSWIFLGAFCYGETAGGASGVTQSVQATRLRQETAQAAQNRVAPILLQYCRDACSLIETKIEVDELVNDTDELGFEGLQGETNLQNLSVQKIILDIQVDDRVSVANRDRLGTILRHNTQNLAPVTDILWKPVAIPQIGNVAAEEDLLLKQLEQRIESTLLKIVDTYCPHQCLLSQVTATGHSITSDEALKLKPEELVRDKSGQSIVKIDSVKVVVNLDAAMTQVTRKKIETMMEAKLKFVTPLDFDIQVSDFPESFAELEEKRKAQSSDPFGLEKLRQTLTIFRELAGTKELITTSSEKMDSKAQTSSESKDESRSTASDKGQTWGLLEYGAAGGGLIVLGVLLLFGMKLVSAQKDAKLMMQNLPAIPFSGTGASSDQGTLEKAVKGLSPEERREVQLRLENDHMKQELIQLFFEAPRVARETFTRLIQEEGIETTAKYVFIFGPMIIFELLSDPSLQRDLHDLSEFYHKSTFNLSSEDLHKSLSSLRVRATANEMRVLTQRQMDKFDFLRSLDANQVYALIIEEKPQIQSIVLTQLDQKRRRSVFEMYTGQRKIDLMKELCRAESIPVEYLSNVAKALQKKITNRPEFDTANLKASDLLFDLLERAELDEQKTLMSGLMETNSEAARAIKIKLVTIEMLPYLKDGHLLEIILGVDRDDLLVFLSGAREHIRRLIISKAPEELSEGWLEDLNNVSRLDEQAFRLIELKLLNRIRQLAANGFINLLDINELIFSSKNPAKSRESTKDAMMVPSKSAMVA